MKIIRNGNTYELTRQEMIQTYHEMRHQLDMEDIQDGVLDTDKYQDLLTNNVLLDLVAHRYRKYLDEHDFEDIKWQCLADAYTYHKK